MCAPTTASRWKFTKARRWAWWASLAAAKSTLGRTILQLYPQTHGDIIYHKDGQAIDLKKQNAEQMRVLRKDLQLIFQDPYSSLNPRMTVGQIIGEGLTSHGIFKKNDPAMKE